MSQYAWLVTCRRCAGAGVVRRFDHVEGGRCFTCGGRGVFRMLSEEIRELGWDVAPTWSRIDFIRSAMGLLAMAGCEGAPSAKGWRTTVCEAIAEVLPLLERTQMEAAVEALREVDIELTMPIIRPMTVEHREVA